jgi:tetratricopeptide (TPR) repeat protein
MVQLQGIVGVGRETVALLLEAGQLLVQMGRHKQASDLFDGVAQLLPHSGVALMLTGNLRFAQGDLAKAEQAHRDAVEREPDRAACWAHLGEALLWLGNVEEGIAACDKAISLATSDPAARQFARNLKQAQELGCFDVDN